MPKYTDVVRGRRQIEPVSKVISMDAVPQPIPERGTKYYAIYQKICGMKAGQALEVGFGSSSHRLYAQQWLRKIAKRDNQLLSSSRSADGMTGYFWLEKA